MLNKRILVLIFLLVFLPLVGCFPTPSNQAPIINSIPVTAVTVGENYVYDVEATDPDGDTLTYSLITKPAGMTINPATGLIKWTPKSKGNHAVVVKVSDGALDIIQGFTIVVSEPSAPPPVNHAPIITSNPNLASLVGIQYTYTIKATDPDGDTLTYYLVSGPDGMTFDTPNISWTPETTGSYDVTVKVSDGKLSDIQSFTITVRDSELELTGIKVEPKEMTLFVEGSETIVSVTATYEFRGYGVLVPLGDCTFLSTDKDIATVKEDGGSVTVTAVKVGTATIIVNYGGKTDTIAVTVIDLVHNINQETYYHTIQAAIDEAWDGDTIEVSAGTYEENVTIDESVTLRGEDRETTEIKFGYGSYPSVSPLTISADEVTVSGLTIRSGPYIEVSPGAFTIAVEGNYALLSDLHLIKDPCLDPNNPIKKGATIFIAPGLKGFIFTDSTVDSDWNGIYAREGGSDIIVRNVEFTYPGEYAILLKEITGAIIEGNTFTCTADKYGVTVTLGSDSIEIVDNGFVGSDSSEGSHTGILLQKYATGTMGEITILNNRVSSFNTGILVEDVTTEEISIHNNNIYNNLSYGVNYLGLDAVNATNNWWGHESGPEHSTNLGGTGDKVSDNVGFDPWSTNPN